MSIAGEQPTMMTVREVAGYLRVHEMTIYRMARHGEIPAYKVGNLWRFNRHCKEEWLSTREVGQGARQARARRVRSLSRLKGQTRPGYR